MAEPTHIWTESMNIRFLKKLESFPCLWNRTSRNFTNPDSKAAALHKLSEHMNLPGCGAELMQRKVLELKAAFAREKRRMYEVRRDGGEFIPRYRWYRIADNFWGKIIRIRRLSFYSNDEVNPVTSSVSTNPLLNSKASITDEALKVCFHKAVNAIRQATALNGNNEFDAFGRCIAVQLNNMTSKAAYEVQAEIQAMISRRKLQSLNRRVLRIFKPDNPIEGPSQSNDEPEAQVRTEKDTFETCRLESMKNPIKKLE